MGRSRHFKFRNADCGVQNIEDYPNNQNIAHPSFVPSGTTEDRWRKGEYSVKLPPTLTSYAKATEVKKLRRAGKVESKAITPDSIL